MMRRGLTDGTEVRTQGKGLTGALASDFASRVLPSAAAASAAAAMRRAFRASVATMVRVTVAPPSLISCRILRHR